MPASNRLPTRRVLSVAIVSMLTASGLPASAQGQSSTDTPQTYARATNAAATPELLSKIDFEGGTLDELIAELRKLPETANANIVLRAEAKDLEIDPFSLQSVTIQTLFDFVVPSGLFGVKNDAGKEMNLYKSYKVIPPSETEFALGARPIHILYAKTSEAPTTRATDVLPKLTVLPLGSIDDGDDSLEIFLDLAMQSLEMGGGPAPEFSFHEPSGMLIVRSTIPQQTVLYEVHELFRNQIAEQIRRRERMRNRMIALENDLFEHRKTLDLLAAEQSSIAEQSETLDDGGVAWQQQRVQELNAIMKQVEQQIAQTERELEVVQNQLD